MSSRIHHDNYGDADDDVLSPPTYNPFLAPPNPESDYEEEEAELSGSSRSRTPKIFDRFDDSSSDDDVGPSDSGGLVQTAGKRLDYMMQYLDRKLSTSDEADRENDAVKGLPEFIASGGGVGIFKPPVRTAVCSDRPPCLELRPHPLRETQVGCFLRTLVSVVDGSGSGSQLWAGKECGVRVWKMSKMYAAGEGEEEEAMAPFYESVPTPATLCVVVDAGNRLAWSGHRDGRIRCWKMDQSVDRDGSAFKECLSWQAHRGPVLSIVITSYGNSLPCYEFNCCCASCASCVFCIFC